MTFLGAEVVWADIADLDQDLGVFAGFLSEEELKRAARFKFERDRDRYVWRRGLLRVALGERLSCAPGDIEFGQGEHGKPCLKTPVRIGLVTNPAGPVVPAGHGTLPATGPALPSAPSSLPSLYFSLSHSDGLVAMAFSRAGEVGVDVERIRPMSDLESLAERCLSETELQDFRQLDSAQATEKFFWYWTRKEAVLKAMGTGLLVEPRLIEVGEGGGLSAVACRAEAGARDGSSGWVVESFQPVPGAWVAVAWEQESVEGI